MARKIGDKIAEAILATHTTSISYEYKSGCWDAYMYEYTSESVFSCTHLEDAEIARSFA